MSNFLSSHHQDELKASSLTRADITALKVFSGNAPTSKRLTGYSIDGLLIPYFDPWGVPYIGHNGGDFYRLKPIPNDDIDDDAPKYLTPKGVGNRPYYPQNFDWPGFLKAKKKSPIIITEGEKTAAALCSAGYPAIGLCGVFGWRDKAERNEDKSNSVAQVVEDDALKPEQLESSRPLPELEELLKTFGERDFIITYDSDLSRNYMVRHAALKLAIWLKEQGSDSKLCLLPTDADGRKNGADDLITRHGKAAIDLLIKNAEPAMIRKNDEWKLNIPKEPDLRVRAIMCQAAFMRSWSYRPGYGWCHWTGKRWEVRDDGQGTYLDAAIYEFLDANEWYTQTNGVMNGLCRHLKAKSVVADGWDQAQIVPFQNGVLDISTGTFRDHCPDDRNTKVLTYSYEPQATAPSWHKFLSEALGGDLKAIELVQAFFRWALTPKGNGKLKLEVCWDLFGKPGTGKGTTLETLRNLVGRDNSGTFKTSQLTNPNYLAHLKDKLCSISSDDSGHLEDVGLFGELISNEPVGIKLLYQNATFTSLNTFFVRAYNDFVTTTGNNNSALDRRIVAMSFDYQPPVRDPYLQERLNSELSGVFNWAWSISETEMLDRVRGAGEIAAVAKASTERFEANNPVFSFLAESYPDGDSRIKPRDLYKQYGDWSRDNGITPLNSRNFSTKLEQFGGHRTGKIGGFFFWIVPVMDEVNILSHLRLGNIKPAPTAPIAPEMVPVGTPRIEAIYAPDQTIRRVYVWVSAAIVPQWEAFVKKCGFSLIGINKTGELMRLSIGKVTHKTLHMLERQNAHFAPEISI